LMFRPPQVSDCLNKTLTIFQRTHTGERRFVG
jgi:hypothetical protein